MSVYFAKRESDGLIKIGWSRSVKLRMGAVRAKMIGAIPGERAQEKKLHKQFAHLRVRGEWFRPGRDLMTYIQTKAQSHKPDSNRVGVGVFVPKSWLEQIDRLAEIMSLPGMKITRAKVHRMVVRRGLDVLTEEFKR